MSPVVLPVVTLIIASYLIGSLPTGYLVVKVLKGIDLRTIGSGSTGTTNVFRAAGWSAAIFVLLVDVAKGYLPVATAAALETWYSTTSPLTSLHLVAPLVAVAVVIGHSKSIFLGFQGGKSAATALGTLLAFNIPVGLSLFIIWAALVSLIRVVSIASIIAAILSTPLMMFAHAALSYTLYVLCATIIVIYRHQANIKRILAGTEPKIGEKSKT